MRALAFILLFAPIAATAWGPEGHAVVADIAATHLTPKTQAAVQALLEGEVDPTLAGVASWADAVRDRNTKAWHFVNLGDDCAYSPPRDCPGGQCIVAALAAQEAILADASQPVAQRRDALKFVVHFVGDIGQPLHTIGHGDKGGNAYQVNLNGLGTNLHKVWDSTIVQLLGHGAAQIAAALTPDPGRIIAFSDPAQFDPAGWAEESCRLVASASIYPAGHKIGDEYIGAHASVVSEQLRTSGERLAAVLNAALDPRHTTN